MSDEASPVEKINNINFVQFAGHPRRCEGIVKVGGRFGFTVVKVNDTTVMMDRPPCDGLTLGVAPSHAKIICQALVHLKMITRKERDQHLQANRRQYEADEKKRDLNRAERILRNHGYAMPRRKSRAATG